MQFQPYLTFNGNCAEAMKFYERVLGGKMQMMMKMKDAPEQCPGMPAEAGDLIMHACLVLEGSSYEKDKTLGERMAKLNNFNDFQVVVLHDSIEFAAAADKFLWATWTRFNPATDIYAHNVEIKHNHLAYTAPVIIDARMKPWYPAEVETREDIKRLVDRRWNEYF